MLHYRISYELLQIITYLCLSSWEIRDQIPIKKILRGFEWPHTYALEI
ncbi:hypothetical protein ROR02_05870 [Pararhodospirillum oryzae]|uniref:Uncharacterized protein n=1 Tax=Pararhodospirillum oryzae TaxID=478448 RepID=A0A512H4S0_9PROT|nr:hypothetical protein ROR02_05870 [Pararhodospirillum oryzae]